MPPRRRLTRELLGGSCQNCTRQQTWTQDRRYSRLWLQFFGYSSPSWAAANEDRFLMMSRISDDEPKKELSWCFQHA
jgi:hypothetical protein